MSLYFFYGQEDYLMEEKISNLRKELLDETFSALNFKIVDNPSFQDLEEILLTPPMMFGNMVVQINMDKYLLSSKSKEQTSDSENIENKSDEEENNKFVFDDAQIKRLEEIMQGISETQTIIFVCKIPREKSKKIDTRKKLYKLFVKYANVQEFQQFSGDYSKELHQWIVKTAKIKGLTISTDMAHFLAQYVGVNLWKLDVELDKINLLIYPNKTITKQDIEKISVPVDNIFNIIKYYVQGRKDLAVLELQKLNNKQFYLITFASLMTKVSNFLHMKILAQSMDYKEIAGKLRLNEYKAKLDLEEIKSISIEDLKNLKKRLSDMELKLKSGQFEKPEIAMETVFLS